MSEEDGMQEGVINDRWPLWLPEDRVRFHAERPGWEAERLASCFELMKPGMTVYDIGAECGDFTALYRSWVGVEGLVVPVEPQPAYWPSIRATLAYAGYGVAPPLFVGFASDETDLHPPLLAAVGDEIEVDGLSGWPRCAYGPIAPDFGFRHLAQQTDGTRQLKIDHMTACLQCAKPDAIVMDIEGAELRALRGALATLVCDRPLVWVSVHEPIMAEWYGHTIDDLERFMVEECHYRGRVLGTSGGEDYWLFQPEEGM